MNHLQVHFFFGLPLDEELQKALSHADQRVCSLLIGEDEHYLTKTDHLGKSYIGKKIAPIESLAELEQLEQNILSLLKKILPNHPLHNIPLELIPFKPLSTI